MSNLRFLSVISYVVAGMVLWAGAFTIAYTAAAIVCARRLGDAAVLGIPILPFSVAATTLAALLASVVIAIAAYRRRSDGAGGAEADQRGFVHTMAMIVALLAAVAVVWNGFPALFFTTCE